MRRPPGRYRRGVDKPSLSDRARRLDPIVWDTLLALALAAVSVIGGVMAAHASPDAVRHDLGVAPYVLVVLGCAPLALRRRWPLAVLIAVSIASIASASLDHSQDLVFALVIASYTAAASVHREHFVRIVAPVAVTASVAGSVISDPQTNWVEVLVAATFSATSPDDQRASKVTSTDSSGLRSSWRAERRSAKRSALVSSPSRERGHSRLASTGFSTAPNNASCAPK
jgi:hypothetical protein